MIRNGMWEIFLLQEPWNQDNILDPFLHYYRLTLDYWKKASGSFKRVLRQIKMWFRTWSGQECTWGKLFKWSSSEDTILVLPTENEPEVYVYTMNSIIYNYYDVLEKTLNNVKSLKINIYAGENIVDWCT